MKMFNFHVIIFFFFLLHLPQGYCRSLFVLGWQTVLLLIWKTDNEIIISVPLSSSRLVSFRSWRIKRQKDSGHFCSLCFDFTFIYVCKPWVQLKMLYLNTGNTLAHSYPAFSLSFSPTFSVFYGLLPKSILFLLLCLFPSFLRHLRVSRLIMSEQGHKDVKL